MQLMIRDGAKYKEFNFKEKKMIKKKKEQKQEVKEFIPGTMLLVTNQVADLVQNPIDHMRGHRAGIEVLSMMLDSAGKHLWATLETFYPAVKDYHCSYDDKTKLITILYRKPEDKKND